VPFDVIVLGLGGMGSAAAAHLAARGQRVLGLEKFGPGHDRGSSHGGSRIIRQAYFEDPAYVPLLTRAYELWAQLERDTGTDLVRLTGGLYLGRPHAAVVAGSLRSAQEYGIPHELLEAREIRRRFPTFTPAGDEVGLFEASAGYVRPEAAVRAHLQQAERHGAELHFDEPANGWEATPSGTRVTTDHATYEAERLVIAPGAWAPQLLRDLDLPLQVERQVQYWFQPAGGTAPFERHPIWIQERTDGLQPYGFPAMDGPEGGVKVAFFRRGRTTSPDDLDREVTQAEAEDMAAHLRDVVPTLPGRLVRAAACMYTVTPDHHFAVARHPEHEQVTVACGFSGHGFKFAPVVGEILADLSTKGTTEHPIGLFDPRRPAMRSGRAPSQ
jgi:sarcosine oxidase